MKFYIRLFAKLPGKVWRAGGAGLFLGATVVSAQVVLKVPSFEADERFASGDINGQSNWVSLANSPSYGLVTNAPRGTPGFLGVKSLLISDRGGNYGTIMATALTNAWRAGEADAVPAPTAGNRFHTEFWFRTAMTGAPPVNYSRFLEMNIGSMRYAQINIGNPGAAQVTYAATNAFNIDPLQDTANGSLRIDLGWYRRIYNDGANYGFPFLRQKLADGLSYGAWYKLTVDATFNDGGWRWVSSSASHPNNANGTLLGNDRVILSLHDANLTCVAAITGGTWEGVFTWPAFGGTSNHQSVLDFQWRIRNPSPAPPLTLTNSGALWIDNPVPVWGARLTVR